MTEESNIDKIVELVNKGKTYEQVAEELDYSSKTVISNKLRSAGYSRNNDFTKTNEGRQLFASLSKEEVEEAGGDTDGKQRYRKVVEDGRIILELTDKKVEKGEE